MNDYIKKQKTLNDKGITLIVLVITVAIMLIIVGISINTGTESLDSTRLKGFYSKLEIIQKRVDDIITTDENYIVQENGETIHLKTAGKNLTAEQKQNVRTILLTETDKFTEEYANEIIDSFRYFTKEQLEIMLDLSEIEYNVFIHFESRIVIAENGIEVGGEEYHILKNNIYFVEHNNTNNEELVTTLEYKPTRYDLNNYKILVIPKNKYGDIKGGTLKYKKTTTKYWETADNLEMVISELTQYNIMYQDNTKNIINKTIKVYLDNGILKVLEYSYS